MGILDGKVAIVTGAGRGVGRGVALDLARAGAAVVVNDLGVSLTGEGDKTTVAEQVAKEIRDFGGRAVANGDSVASWEGAHRIVEAALELVRPHRRRRQQCRQPARQPLPQDDGRGIRRRHRRPSQGVVQRQSRGGAPFQEPGVRRLCPYDLDFGAHRQFRAGELFRGQARRRRSVEIHRARHAALQRALQRGRALRLDADDRTRSRPTRRSSRSASKA